MKKLHFYVVMVLLLAGSVSCGNDDDQVVEDRILGIWNIDRLLVDENFVELNECERRSTIQFFAAGSFSEVIYEGENPTSCTSEILEGDWSNLSIGTYELEYPELDMVINATLTGTELTLQYTAEDDLEGEQEYVRIYKKN